MVHLCTLDYALIITFFIITSFIGIYISKKPDRNSSKYFLSGRTMPWLLLGVSFVATTFSTDTPNLATDIVRTYGVSGEGVWWAFLITGLIVLVDSKDYGIMMSMKANSNAWIADVLSIKQYGT